MIISSSMGDDFFSVFLLLFCAVNIDEREDKSAFFPSAEASSDSIF